MPTISLYKKVQDPSLNLILLGLMISTQKSLSRLPPLQPSQYPGIKHFYVETKTVLY